MSDSWRFIGDCWDFWEMFEWSVGYLLESGMLDVVPIMLLICTCSCFFIVSPVSVISTAEHRVVVGVQHWSLAAGPCQVEVGTSSWSLTNLFSRRSLP